MDKLNFHIDIVATAHPSIVTRLLNILSRKRIEIKSIHVDTCRGSNVQKLAISFIDSRNTAEYLQKQISKAVDVFTAVLREEKSAVDRWRRTLVHPGKFNPVRIHFKHSPTSKHYRLKLAPYANLHDAIVNPLRKIGIENALISILGGTFNEIYYCVAPPDTFKQAVIAYSDPIQAGFSYLVVANATLGKNINGEPLIHCHGGFLTSKKILKGGHIVVNRSIIGPHPVFAHVISFDEINILQKLDSETNVLLLEPQMQ